MGAYSQGERIFEAVSGKRRERTSIIAASKGSKLVAPFVFQGSCNTEVVDVYFAQVLLPVVFGQWCAAWLLEEALEISAECFARHEMVT